MVFTLLMRWIVSDDQSINVIENFEFRELLVYLGQGEIENQEIPHRTKLTQGILREFRGKTKEMQSELQNCLGRVSYTTDLWSDTNLTSFMAVTAHYIVRSKKSGNLSLRTKLIAFRHITGSHTGVNLANEFFVILNELGVIKKIGEITMDNASNNNTFMQQLEREKNIPFNSDGNRIRCFPHIINIACQRVIEELKTPPKILRPMASMEELARDTLYRDALNSDVIGFVRKVIKICRSSGQRRQMVKSIIIEGNEKGWWKGRIMTRDGEVVDDMEVLQLLRDCETRWSSTFNMIDRFLYLYPAIESFLHKIDDGDIAIPSDRALAVMWDIRQMLEVPHVAQELLSSERTPTLAFSIPAYEELIFQWKRLARTLPELSYFINIGINKLEEYLSYCQKTRIYVHAMVNPSMKFTWLEQHRSAQVVTEARNWIKSSMLKFQREHRQNSQWRLQRSSLLSMGSGTAQASQAIQTGYNRLRNLKTGVRRFASFSSSLSVESSQSEVLSQTPSVASTSTSTVSDVPPLSVPEVEDDNERAARESEEDTAVVEEELKRYEEAGIDNHCQHTEHILRVWERTEFEFLLLFRIAMDVLPVQASAVPCERIFSSSKETSTLRRTRLTPKLMEALQVLKFSYKQEKLDFMNHWGVSKEVDYSISGVLTDAALCELSKAGEWEVLEDILANEEGVSESNGSSQPLSYSSDEYS